LDTAQHARDYKGPEHDPERGRGVGGSYRILIIETDQAVKDERSTRHLSYDRKRFSRGGGTFASVKGSGRELFLMKLGA